MSAWRSRSRRTNRIGEPARPCRLVFCCAPTNVGTPSYSLMCAAVVFLDAPAKAHRHNVCFVCVFIHQFWRQSFIPFVFISDVLPRVTH